jgi:hypothetical protein
MHKDIETHRELWATIAKKNNWYAEPFFVQLWVNDSGDVLDSVSHGGMTQDIVVVDNDYEEWDN